MLKLKVIKVGNSAGVVLPKKVLSHLDVENGDEVFLTATEGGLLGIRDRALLESALSRPKHLRPA